MNNILLKFGRGNAKLAKEIYTFSLPAGWTCPGAHACLARADRFSGKLTDGAEQSFRCFAASEEAAYPTVRLARWHNFDLLTGLDRHSAKELLLASLPAQASIVRIHVSGDFFSAAYFLAWCDVARERSTIKFYAYTKSIHFWKRQVDQIPANLVLTASEGGKFDPAINGFKRAKVVYSQAEAAALDLEIDHDDRHAYEQADNFALLLHGGQAKGSVAAKALSALRAAGHQGYSRK
ncbi:MAG: hypothetical protein DMG76_23620 [Acidobacteria bacterium]|nr:MAG: hypothetical protein DMG76_23620 [Acidobacteriota bacterium]